MFHILTLTNMDQENNKTFSNDRVSFEAFVRAPFMNHDKHQQRNHLQTARKWVRWNPVRLKKLTENDRRFRSELKYLAHLQSLTFCKIIGCVNALLMKENSRFTEYKDFWTSPKLVTRRINRIHFTFEERREVKCNSVSRGFVPTTDKIRWLCRSSNWKLITFSTCLHKLNSIISLEVCLGVVLRVGEVRWQVRML